MSQITKNQHWVPQTYLKRFSDKSLQGKLFVTDVKRYYAGNGTYVPAVGEPSTPCKEPIKDIASMDYLYSHIESGVIRNGIEDSFFQPMEKQIGVLLSRCEQGNLDIANDHAARRQLAEFAASLHLRHPRMVSISLGCDAEDAPLGPSHADIDARRGFRTTQEDLTPVLTKMLLERQWRLYEFATPALITSDTPVFMAEFPDFSRGRLDSATTVVYLPLTSRHLLAMPGARLDAGPSGQLNNEVADSFNRFIVNYAERFVYSSRAIPREWAKDVPA